VTASFAEVNKGLGVITEPFIFVIASFLVCDNGCGGRRLHQSTLVPVGALGGDQGMKVLGEMNELGEGREEFVIGLAPRVDVL